MRFSTHEMKQMIESLDHELVEQETAHTHHCKDGHGNDRCYITNVGERILFYCHHCGKKGGLANNLAAFKRVSRGSPTPLSKGIWLPSDCQSDPLLWPVAALKWLLEAKIDVQTIKEFNLQYSAKIDRVLIPIQFDGEYQGYTARRIGTEGPKYLAHSKDKDHFIFTAEPRESPSVVIVEDILSAIKLASYGYNAIALQGVNVTTTLLNYITNNYTEYYIWLDNDNPIVKRQQLLIRNRLSLFGKATVVRTEHDPKDYTKAEVDKCIK